MNYYIETLEPAEDPIGHWQGKLGRKPSRKKRFLRPGLETRLLKAEKRVQDTQILVDALGIDLDRLKNIISRY